MDWLKELLGDDLFSKVSEKLGDTKVLKDDGTSVPYARFKKVNDQKNVLQDQVTELQGISTKYDELQTDVAKWKEEAESIPALKKKMEEWEKSTTDLQGQLSKANEKITEFTTKEEEYQKELRSTRINSEVEKLFLTNQAKHVDLLKGQIDMSKLEIQEDGTIKGLQEQFDGLKETYKDFFGEERFEGGTPGKGGNPDPKDLSEMTDQEYYAYIKAQNK